MAAHYHHLHARKRAGEEESGIVVFPHHSSPVDIDDHIRRKRKGTSIPTELTCAIVAVVLFLFVGLFFGYFLMHHQRRKVILHAIRDPLAHGAALFQSKGRFHHHFFSGNPRFVTVLLPSVVNQKGRPLRLQTIYETWGGHARAIFVVHNLTEFPDAVQHGMILSDTVDPVDRYSFPQSLLVPPNVASPDDGVPRLFYVIRTILRRVNPDFAFFANDHTFVIPSHACAFLRGKDPREDLYAGHALRNEKEKDVFNSGAAGYFLSRETMTKLINLWDAKDSRCFVGSEASKWLQGNPGLVSVKCLDALGVHAIDTRSASKWHRFHAFPLTRVVKNSVDDWYVNKHLGMSEAGFDESYETLLGGEDCCSRTSISFHYVEFKEAKALWSVRQCLLEDPGLSDSALKEMMMDIWPKTTQEVGGYSHGLPNEDDEGKWATLLSVIRKISLRRDEHEC